MEKNITCFWSCFSRLKYFCFFISRCVWSWLHFVTFLSQDYRINSERFAHLLYRSSFNWKYSLKLVEYFRELRKIRIEAGESNLGHDLHYVLLLYLSRPSLPLSLSLFILISIYLSPFDSSFVMSVRVNPTSYVVVITHEYLTYVPCLTTATHTRM